MKLEVHRFASIAEVGPACWDRLAQRHGVYASHAWHLAEESYEDSTCEYVVITTSGEGELLGAAALNHVHYEPSRHYQPHALGLEERPVPEFGQVGARRGYRGGPMIADLDGPCRRAVAELLAAEIAHFARRRAIPVYCLYVPADSVDVLQHMSCDGPVVRLEQEAFLLTPNGRVEDVLASVPARWRKKLRREREVFLDAGYTVGVEDPLPVVDQLASCMAQLEWKYGGRTPLDSYRAHLGSVFASPLAGEVLTLRRDEHVVGFCQFYPFGPTMWARIVGFDYPRLAGRFEYFNLVYFELAESAGAYGARSVHLGVDSLDAKVRHGAVLMDLWAARLEQRAGAQI